MCTPAFITIKLQSLWNSSLGGLDGGDEVELDGPLDEPRLHQRHHQRAAQRAGARLEQPHEPLRRQSRLDHRPPKRLHLVRPVTRLDVLRRDKKEGQGANVTSGAHRRHMARRERRAAVEAVDLLYGAAVSPLQRHSSLRLTSRSPRASLGGQDSPCVCRRSTGV